MKSFFRFVLLSLVLLVVALVSALTAMRFAIHGREVDVPDLVGKTPAEARKIADAAGFQMDIERQYYSPTVPEGKVLSQLPPPGTKVRRGWQIRIAQSLGPQRVQIPNVLGESQRAAEINILRRGLNVGAVAQIGMHGAPPDQVLGQSPPPNASGIAAPKISLLTAESAMPQAFLMPNFIGQALGGVTLVLQDAGFRLGEVSIAPSASAPPASATEFSIIVSPPPVPPPQPTPASIIVSQNPAPGAKIVVGSAVNFEVR
ncbi:MAG TPA: PASTA domain-containing protein [Terriglobales bacterium]|jgi:beta-lactam-binding protein with PASTA domain|nr:PASTA domain-containing protein [Terriglobales bacterium]